MELKGSKTEANLMTAFAGESQATNKYTYYASQAKKDGYVQISKIFEETAGNEREHAKLWFKLLHEGNKVPDTLTNLADAAAGEDVYKRQPLLGFIAENAGNSFYRHRRVGIFHLSGGKQTAQGQPVGILIVAGRRSRI